MDTGTIGLAAALLGVGGLGGLLGRLLGHRERSALREDEKYWRLVDEQQGTINSLTARVDALLVQQAAQFQQIASLLSEVIRLRSILHSHGINDDAAYSAVPNLGDGHHGSDDQSRDRHARHDSH